MRKEELKDWFWDKFNSCYSVKHDDYPHSVFMIYDLNYIRAKKLSNILNKDVEYPTMIKGVCLFEQDLKNEWLYCDYEKIWTFFKNNYSGSSQEISDLIKGWMEEHNKLKVLTPNQLGIVQFVVMEEHNKLKVLTPEMLCVLLNSLMEEHNKLKVLTPMEDIILFNTRDGRT